MYQKSKRGIVSGRPLFTLLCVAMVLTMSNSARAAMVINVTEQGSDVVATVTGTLDLSALHKDVTDPAGVSSYMWLDVGDAMTFGGADANSFYDADTIIAPGSDMGSGGFLAASSVDPGTIIGWYGSKLIIGEDYVSEAVIYREMTFAGATLSSLGMNEGTYTWSFTTSGNTDTYTVNVGAVPEPATFGLLAISGGGLLLFRRLRFRWLSF